MRKKILPIIFALTLSAFSYAQHKIEKIDLSQEFENNQSTFVLLDTQKKIQKIYNLSEARKRHCPCSTFKIPHTLFGLETGILKNKNHRMKWDGKKRKRSVCNKNHTLQTAFSNSVIWYYQNLASKIGSKRMQNLVNKVNYGNKNISSDLKSFWLYSSHGSLKISALEQIEFLEKLFADRLPFSHSSINQLQDIMLMKKTKDYSLYGKTGLGFIDPQKQLTWFVGFVDRGENRYYFAAKTVGYSGSDLRFSKTACLKSLRKLKIIS